MFAHPCDVSRTHQGRLCKLLSRPRDSDQYRDSGSLSCPSSRCGPLLAVSPLVLAGRAHALALSTCGTSVGPLLAAGPGPGLGVE